MKSRTSINVIAGAVTLGAAVWLYYFLNPRPASIDEQPQRAVGEVLAAEAGKLMQSGSRLVVISRVARPFKVPAAEAQLSGLLKALEKSGIKVSAHRTLALDPLRVTAVPSGEFFDVLRQSKEEDVIVSLLGPPALDAEQITKLGAKRPRILAVCSGTTPFRVDLKRLFEQKLLMAAVVSKSDSASKTTAVDDRLAFDRHFKLITPANVAELSAVAMAPP